MKFSTITAMSVTLLSITASAKDCFIPPFTCGVDIWIALTGSESHSSPIFRGCAPDVIGNKSCREICKRSLNACYVLCGGDEDMPSCSGMDGANAEVKVAEVKVAEEVAEAVAEAAAV